MDVQPALKAEFDTLEFGDADRKIDVLARLWARADDNDYNQVLLEYVLSEQEAKRIARSPLRLEPEDIVAFRERLWPIARGGPGAWEAWFACIVLASLDSDAFQSPGVEQPPQTAESLAVHLASASARVMDALILATREGEAIGNLTRSLAQKGFQSETIRALSFLGESNTARSKLREILDGAFLTGENQSGNPIRGKEEAAAALAVIGDEESRDHIIYMADVENSAAARKVLESFGTASFDEIQAAIKQKNKSQTSGASKGLIATLVIGGLLLSIVSDWLLLLCWAAAVVYWWQKRG